MGAISVVFLVSFVPLILSGFVQGVDEVKGYPPSINCANTSCPSYQVIHSQKEFEIRTYETRQWIASDNVTTINYGVGWSAGYIYTFNYYRGVNQQQKSWDEITQPTLTDVTPNTDYDSIYRVYLYVPNDYQNKTLAKPYTDSGATVVKLPNKKFAAVVRFDGRIRDDILAAQLAALKSSLKGTQWESAAAATSYTVADYQFQRVQQQDNRINEVILWFD